MNQTQAITKLKRLLGPKLGYRIDPKALDAEGRESARVLARELTAKKIAAEEAMNARRAELLRDPIYQGLRREFSSLRDQQEQAQGAARHMRITVGTTGGVFFNVKAEGDNWDEVVALVEKDQHAIDRAA